MTIHYKCRHCQKKVGQLKEQQLSSDSLGFADLSSEDRAEMLSYEANGDIHVNVICEDCHETLIRNPDFYELDTFIQ